MLSSIEAAIFDMDGTLIDSMGLWYKIDYEFLNKRGIPLPKDLKENIEHLSFEETAKYFKNRFNLKDTEDEILKEWYNMAYYEYSNCIVLKEGAYKFLSHLKENNIKLALATSNAEELTEAVLKKNKIYNFFDAFTYTSEVDKPKSCPDVYLLAAEKLNVSPENCLVFEDILSGIIGAKKAGMKAYGVYDESSKENIDMIKEKADGFIENYGGYYEL
ncbi:MAG: HAD family phosphatase [Bacillota bacterium]|nr:HAD family phosphatase [Bacillota bacterium]